MSFFSKIFSVKNEYNGINKIKVITILGIKIKFSNKELTWRRNLELLIYGINFSTVTNATNLTSKKEFKDRAILFRYDYFKCNNTNLGDYIQTIATRNTIKHIYPNISFDFWDRDNLMHYCGKPGFTIMQGWFAHDNLYLPNEKLLPIFIGTHISPSCRENFLNFIRYNPAYFKDITFGCRDISTLNFMKNLGFSSYLSRCLTLTLPKRQPSETHTKTYIVDIPKDLLKYMPKYITKNAILINQKKVDVNNELGYFINSEQKYLPMAENLLAVYANNANLVITSALHCASPCIAMGIPTIFINIDNEKERFGSLSGISKIYTKTDLINGNINFQPTITDIEKLKQLMIKNVELSIKEAFDEYIDKEELNNIRQQIENYMQ